MIKHIVFISLLFTISVQAFEPHTENRRSSAPQAGDQLSQFEQEFQQALEKIAVLESENRELKDSKRKIFKYIILPGIPIMMSVGAISVMLGKKAKEGLYQADNALLEEVGNFITDPKLARGLAQKHPALYGNCTSFFNETVTVHINPLHISWALGTSLYNGYYHRMKNDEGYNAKTLVNANRQWIATTHGVSSQEKNNIQGAITKENGLNDTILKNKLNHSEIVQLTACEILKQIVRSVHIIPKKDPIAPLPGTNITIMTSDQLVSSVLKAGADKVEQLVISRIKCSNGQPPQGFAQQFTKYASVEIMYNLIAQTAHLITKNNDGNANPWVETLFPMNLNQPKTTEQLRTESIIKWLLINGTPYVYQKISAQPSA